MSPSLIRSHYVSQSARQPTPPPIGNRELSNIPGVYKRHNVTGVQRLSKTKPARKRLKRATPGGIPGWIRLLKTNGLRLTADVCSNMEMVEVVAAIIERGGE